MDKNRWVDIIQWAFRIVLGAILIFAGVMKIQDNTALFETVAYITWFPVWLRWWIVDLLPWVEILIGAQLFYPKADRLSLPVATSIYFVFFLFAIYGTATGIEGDCGCFGEMAASTFGPGMIIRNGIFVAMATVLFYRPGEVDVSSDRQTEREKTGEVE
ncbi:MAG: MauE/DoxX family redox-associated membrane protein [Balneolaceae bacterium]